MLWLITKNLWINFIVKNARGFLRRWGSKRNTQVQFTGRAGSTWLNVLNVALNVMNTDK